MPFYGIYFEQRLAANWVNIVQCLCLLCHGQLTVQGKAANIIVKQLRQLRLTHV